MAANLWPNEVQMGGRIILGTIFTPTVWLLNQDFFIHLYQILSQNRILRDLLDLQEQLSMI